MEERIKAIEKEQVRQGKDITEMKNALLGTDYTNKQGMIDAVQQNTKFRRASIKRIGVVTGFSTAVGFMFGAGWTWIKTKLGL